MDDPFLAVAGLCAALGLSALVSGVPPRVKVAMVLFLALPQLYLLPQGNVDISVATVLTLMVVPGLAAGVGAAHPVLLRTLVALLAVRLAALAWSPEPRAGLQPLVLLGQFLVTLLLMSQAVREDAGVLRRLQFAYWPWVVLEALLVIVFRMQPASEAEFVQSIGGYFAGHNAVAGVFDDNPNNILDPAKAGGVFLNANVAAMFLGVNALAAFAISALTRARSLLPVGAMALAAVPFTGSKSATILALALPAVAFGSYHVYRSTKPAVRRYLLITLVSLGMVGIVTLNSLNIPLFNDSQAALDNRAIIWGFGAEAFRQSPFLGLGYGGWDIGFAPYAADHGLFRVLPPHNILINAWSTTGLAGLVLTLGFLALPATAVPRRLVGRYKLDPRFVVYGGAAVAWVLIQGMGENADFFGDVHLIPIVSLLLVHLVRPTDEEMRESVTAAHRRDCQAPVVPAVGNVHRQSGTGAPAVPAPVRWTGQGAAPSGRRLG